MALNANCVANVTTSGSDSNAGWFDTTSGDTAGGVNDRAFSNSPIIIDGVTITASVHSTTTQANIVGHTLATTDRGNVLRITGGTATAGYYRITSVDTANNRVTVDASMGSASATITGRIGGAFASPGQAGASFVGGATVNVAAGTYAISTASTNVSGGCVSMATSFSDSDHSTIRGYTAVYGDGGKPTLQISSGVSNATILAFTDRQNRAMDLSLDGNSQTGSVGISISGGGEAIRVIASNFSSRGFNGTSCIQCESLNCTTGFDSCETFYCKASGGTTGYTNVRGSYFSVAFSCSGTGFSISTFDTCVFVGNAVSLCGTGFGGGQGRRHRRFFIENVSYGNTTNWNTSQTETVYFRNATSSSRTFGSQIIEIDTVTLTADPFVDAANGNFALNSTSGGGATLRALNFQLPSISTTRYPFGGWYAPGGGCPLIGPGGLVY
jgi:hypothetical protein